MNINTSCPRMIPHHRNELERAVQKWGKPVHPKLAFLSEALCHPRGRNSTVTTEQHRQETLERVKAVMRERVFTIEQVAYAFDQEPIPDLVQMLALLDPSAATLFWVHNALWGVSILKLGTQKHRDLYLEKSQTLEILGSCHMTEVGHGSDVSGLMTQATYVDDDPRGRGFILNTPCDEAKKAYIGGGAMNATHGVVFARLNLKGVDKGVHGFVVEMRRNGQNLPGIDTQDMGRKLGLNGVDNAFISYNNLFIPYDQLLDYYAEITPEGEYVGKNGNTQSLFLIYKLMSQFVRGRQVIALASEASFKQMAAMLFCYPLDNLLKREWEETILFALGQGFGMEAARRTYLGRHLNDHFRASIMKVIGSESCLDAIITLGKLYGTVEEIREVAVDYEFDAVAPTIYEGANTVLLQLGAFFVLKKLKTFVEELSALKWDALRKVLRADCLGNDPLSLLRTEVLNTAKNLGEQLQKCPKDQQVELWSTKLQAEGIEMARKYGYIMILYSLADEVARKNDPLWNSLYKVYSWQVYTHLGGEMAEPLEARAYVLSHLDQLVGKAGIPLNWIDAVLPPIQLAEVLDPFYRVKKVVALNLPKARL